MPMEDWIEKPLALSEMDRQIIVRALAALSLHTAAYYRLELLAGKFEGGLPIFTRQRRLLAREALPGLPFDAGMMHMTDPLKDHIDYLRGYPDEETGGGLILPIAVMIGHEPVRFEIRGGGYVGAGYGLKYAGDITIVLPTLESFSGSVTEQMDKLGAIRFPVVQPETGPQMDLTTAELFLCFPSTMKGYRLGRVRDALLPGSNLVQVIGFVARQDVPAPICPDVDTGIVAP
jgi:hypothetical protein